MSAFLDKEDGYGIAMLTLHNSLSQGRPRNYAVTSASNRLIDEVRYFLGRTGKKLVIAVPAFSLDAYNATQWLQDDESVDSHETTITSNDNFDSMIDMLDDIEQKNVLTLLFKEQQSLKQVSDILGVSMSEVNKIKETSFTIIKNNIDRVGFIKDIVSGVESG